MKEKFPNDPMERRRVFYNAIDSGGLDLAETIKLMRRFLGKTQPEFAKLVKVSVAIIRAIEQGHANPRLDTLAKIGAPFGLDLRFARRKATTYPDLPAADPSP
jgi:transcriptional regulator with XRE-family HTH domain